MSSLRGVVTSNPLFSGLFWCECCASCTSVPKAGWMFCVVVSVRGLLCTLQAVFVVGVPCWKCSLTLRFRRSLYVRWTLPICVMSGVEMFCGGVALCVVIVYRGRVVVEMSLVLFALPKRAEWLAWW